jgi:hypothetical protein
MGRLRGYTLFVQDEDVVAETPMRQPQPALDLIPFQAPVQ